MPDCPGDIRCAQGRCEWPNCAAAKELEHGRPTLQAFVLARVEEDEALAHEERRQGWIDVNSSLQEEFGPSRVLAECATKRRILHIHSDWTGDGGCTGCGFGSDEERMNTVDQCPTLHALTLAYAGHPDFRAEWRSA